MPKVKSYSASWLASNAIGRKLFEPSDPPSHSHTLSSPHLATKKKITSGPRRTVARRGTEVFVAVGKEIRWADLVYLKEQHAAKQARAKSSQGLRAMAGGSASGVQDEDMPSSTGLRTIKTPVADEIRQLVLSPNGNFLAIITTHTVHICIVPDSSHLTSSDETPLKPKIFTLGPTTHVTSRSPVASVLWHPLGVNGSCVVTITADAIVRAWELSISDRWSFDSPTTSVDLKKLADGISLDQDFSASTSATNKAFSPDSFEMEVAAASFASKSSGGWNPMTLWVAMREGTLYALCPLLPQRWAPSPILIPSLAVSVVTTVASIEDDPSVDDRERLLAAQQLEWMGQVDAQEPQVIEGLPGEPPVEVYSRPSRPGIAPRLQGPLDLDYDPDTGDELDTSISDILVIGKKSDMEDLMLGEEDDLDLDETDSEGLSIPIICLLSTSGQVRIYLDVRGIQAQWLPPKHTSKRKFQTSGPSMTSLLCFQALETMSPMEVSDEGWPTFSLDVTSRYSFFVTHHAAITHISLVPWVFRLEGELNEDSEAGGDFRIGLLINSQASRDRIYTQPATDGMVPLAAAVAILDPDMGYIVLSATPWHPIIVILELSDSDFVPAREQSPIYEREPSIAPLEFHEPRPVFQTSRTFDQASALPTLLDRLRTSRHKTIMNQVVKLSPLSLQIMTNAHQALSDETHRLGLAAAEVFRRCESLQAEFQQQILKAHEVSERIDTISGTHRMNESDNAMFERRMLDSKNRHAALAQRLENLRKEAIKAGNRGLSAKERAFANEVNNLHADVSGGASSESKPLTKELWKRLEDVKQLQGDLLEEVKEAQALQAQQNDKDASFTPSAEDLRIPLDIRRAKLQQVQGLLARETALVEAVTSRLEKLQTDLS